MEPHLLIKINRENTNVSYIDTGDKLHTHDYNYGYAHGKDRLRYLYGVLYMMEMINIIDPIPNKIIIKFDTTDNRHDIDNSEMRHMKGWYSDILNQYNYTQFIFRNDKRYRPVHVIINSDERHQKHNTLGLRH